MAPELGPKRLEIISELVPEARAIALLVNPNNSNTERIIGDMQEAARAKGVQLRRHRPVRVNREKFGFLCAPVK